MEGVERFQSNKGAEKRLKKVEKKHTKESFQLCNLLCDRTKAEAPNAALEEISLPVKLATPVFNNLRDDGSFRGMRKLGVVRRSTLPHSQGLQRLGHEHATHPSRSSSSGLIGSTRGSSADSLEGSRENILYQVIE